MMFLDVSLLRLPLTSAESQKQALTKSLHADSKHGPRSALFWTRGETDVVGQNSQSIVVEL